jgi:hypothetical protein
LQFSTRRNHAAGIVRLAARRKGEERVFFFEKKKQKTFVSFGFGLFGSARLGLRN